MKDKLIVSNWKMKPNSAAEAQEILDSVRSYIELPGPEKELDLVFCPPFIFIEDVAKFLAVPSLAGISSLGAQDIAEEDNAALTGEISGPMLQKLGVRYVIIGHSERRWKLGESDEVVNKKLKAALRNNLIPIVCIGEKERDQGFNKSLEDQIARTFEGVSSEELQKCLIAYEPVWAISSNPGARPDNPESALESIEVIEGYLSLNWQINKRNMFLYGGSVNSKNAVDFLSKEKINGVLVGGASVNKEEFIKILSLIS